MVRKTARFVFLDVDGVLNSIEWQHELHEQGKRRDMHPDDLINPEMMERLNRIVEVGKADVVVSSAWRTARRVEQLQALFERHGFRGKVVGKTGHGFNGERGMQILNWLELTGNEKAIVVVLDDEESDMGQVLGVLVKTDGQVGLTDEDVKRAVTILKTPNEIRIVEANPKTAMSEAVLDASVESARQGKMPRFVTSEMDET